MKYKYRLLFVTISLGTFLGCKKEIVKPEDLGLAYFPLEVGAVTVYDVDSTVYNDFTTPVSVTLYTFQLKDSIINTSTDSENITNYRVERYKKTATQNWTFQRTFVKRIINNRAEEFVDNKRYVKLVFPVKLSRSWNGNLYNGDEPATYEITNSNEPLRIGNLQLDSTATINQINDVNLIREDVVNETYSKGIGLVLKEVRAIDKNIANGEIKRGSIYNIKLNSFK